MGQIIDLVKAWAAQHCEDPTLTVSEDGEHASLEFNSSNGKDFNYRAYYDANEDEQIVQLYLYAPITVPIEKRSAAADVVARINTIIFSGRIDLKMDTGVLRFRDGIDVKTGQAVAENLWRLLDTGNSTLNEYLPVISSVIYAGISPAEAFARANHESAEDQTEPESDTATESAPNVKPWDDIAGADLLQPWSQELKAALLAKDAEEWRDVGRAVVLVADDEQRCKEALQRVALDASMRYVVFEDDDVMDLPPRAAFAASAPALIFLAPGRWLIDRQKGDSDEVAVKFSDFQKRLVHWIKAFDVSMPVVLCTMVYELGDMADAMDGLDRFDRYFALPPLTHADRGAEFIEKLGPARCGESITAAPDKLGKLLDDKYKLNERCALALLYLRRLSRRVQRPIEFLDLMHMTTHGFGEESAVEHGNDDVRRQIAVHEAGHAAMAILDSAGRNVPDYCSILPGADFNGVVAESIGYHQSLGDRTTYADFRHNTRICLAGRAAEELVFGAERVSSGAASDLASAWKGASRAFTRWGFAPQMAQAHASGSNLAVVVGDPTPTESAHVEGLIRQFLAIEYAVDLQCLAANRDLLNAITERLLTTAILDQAELNAICQVHRNPAQ